MRVKVSMKQKAWQSFLPYCVVYLSEEASWTGKICRTGLDFIHWILIGLLDCCRLRSLVTDRSLSELSLWGGSWCFWLKQQIQFKNQICKDKSCKINIAIVYKKIRTVHFHSDFKHDSYSINSSVVSLRTGLGMGLFPVRIPAVRRKTWGESHSKQTNQKTDQGTFHWSHSGTWLIQLIHRITRINSPDCSVCSVPVLNTHDGKAGESACLKERRG